MFRFNRHLTLNFDHVLTIDEMELLHHTFTQIVHDDEEPNLYFSTTRDENGFYETMVKVHLPASTFDEVYEDVFGRPPITFIIAPAKYKQDFIDQAALMETPELKFSTITEKSGKEMMKVEFVNPSVFPDIMWYFDALNKYINKQENPKPKRPSGPRFTNLKTED